MKLITFFAPVALGALLTIGCGGGGSVGNDGSLVGGSCETNDDCDVQCEQDGDFPGGVCTQSCEVSDECPSGSVCVEKEGGLCLLDCSADSDCREGWNCEDVDLQGSEEKARVCQKD